jgi:hypothetical protein
MAVQTGRLLDCYDCYGKDRVPSVPRFSRRGTFGDSSTPREMLVAIQCWPLASTVCRRLVSSETWGRSPRFLAVARTVGIQSTWERKRDERKRGSLTCVIYLR